MPGSNYDEPTGVSATQIDMFPTTDHGRLNGGRKIPFAA